MGEYTFLSQEAPNIMGNGGGTNLTEVGNIPRNYNTSYHTNSKIKPKQQKCHQAFLGDKYTKNAIIHKMLNIR